MPPYPEPTDGGRRRRDAYRCDGRPWRGSRSVMPKRRGAALIVDDDVSVGQVLKDMVEASGYAVTHVVRNDTDAYALFDTDQRWAVAFVDLNLGKGPTGVEVARQAA